jgi:polysaccharide export outer membrane protein
MFSETLGTTPIDAQRIGAGDVIEVSIWEAPPAALFGAQKINPRAAPSSSQVTTLPEQMVNNEGFIYVPFAGQVKAAGQSLTQIEHEIAQQLKGKANQPQVLVRLTRNVSSNVTVVGEVANSTRVPLTPHGEKLLDALAAAGGVRQPVNKMTIQVTRGSNAYTLPLETIIKDPQQNVPLQPSDVVTALFQPLSFTALGATGKNEEINFEAQGITLAQALARTGGLIDARADAQGVFIFRFEPQDTLQWPQQPVLVTPEGQVPVIYRIDLKDPGSFFVAQNFPVNNKDLLYVSNAPFAELQKFLNLVFLISSPALNAAAISTR